MRDHCRHAHSVRAASSVRADMIFGKDRCITIRCARIWHYRKMRSCIDRVQRSAIVAIPIFGETASSIRADMIFGKDRCHERRGRASASHPPSGFAQAALRAPGALYLLAAMCVLLTLVTPGFFTTANLTNVGLQVAV